MGAPAAPGGVITVPTHAFFMASADEDQGEGRAFFVSFFRLSLSLGPFPS